MADDTNDDTEVTEDIDAPEPTGDDSTTVHVRVTRKLKARWEEAAAAKGDVGLSAWIRWTLTEACKKAGV